MSEASGEASLPAASETAPAVASILGNLVNSKTASDYARVIESILPRRLLHYVLTKWQNIDIPAWTVAIAILGALPGTLNQLRSAALAVYWWIARFFVSSISINGNDRLNKDVINWVAHNVLPNRSVRSMTARTEVIQTNYWDSRIVERDDVRHEKRMPVQYLPAFGATWFIYNGRLFIVSRVLDSKAESSTHSDYIPVDIAAAPEGHEPLVVMCLSRSVQPLKDFLESCRNFTEQQNRKYVTVRTTQRSYYGAEEVWGAVALRPTRHMDTVHFDEQTKAALIKDIAHYLEPSTRQFYLERGIPYRRGYLLHGPPGTGKTSLSLALASLFGLDLYLCHLPSVRDDSTLHNLFANLPPKCIVLLEDIDTVGVRRRHKDDGSDSEDPDSDSERTRKREYRFYDGGPGCSLAGLLNVLDGVASQEGRIVLMTSNFADKLDRALVRPGRVDQMVFLGYISRQSAEKMFLRMYSPKVDNKAKETSLADTSNEELQEMARKFSSQLPEETFTPAQLQGFLLSHRADARAAVAGISSWVAEELRVAEEAEKLAKARNERRARRRMRRKERRGEVCDGEGLNSGDSQPVKGRQESADEVIDGNGEHQNGSVAGEHCGAEDGPGGEKQNGYLKEKDDAA